MGAWEEMTQDLAPTCLRGPDGQKFLGFLGAQKDALQPVLRDAVKVRWPTIGPDDALFRQGADRVLEQFDGESNDSYRARLLVAFETWSFGGTGKAIIDSLHAYGITDVEVKEDWEWHGADGTWYSRYWIIIGPTMPYSRLVGPFNLGPNVTLGSTATPTQIAAVKKQVMKWKSAHGYPVKVILRFPSATLLGVNTIMPFTPPTAANYGECTWDIGRLIQVNVFTMPFISGGFEV